MRAARVFVMLALVLCGCGSQPQPVGVVTPAPSAIQHEQMTVGGIVRSYRLFEPPSVISGGAVALVLLLHPCNSSGDHLASATHFDEQATSARLVVAYPDGLANFGPGFAHCWNEFLDPTMPDDLAFLGQLMDRLKATLPINPHRIFVAGQQSGGHMAYTLACAIPGRLTGIASVSGGMPLDGRAASMRCASSQSTPVSVMEMHGTSDDFIPYEGGGGLAAPATVDLIKYWATVDRCSGDPVVAQNGITKSEVWKLCRGATTVRLDTVSGGHSTWFGSSVDSVLGEPNATAAVWTFFNSVPAKTQ